MVETLHDTTFFTLLKQTVEQHGCTIVDVDFDTHVINLDGPEDVVHACALALENLMQ